jgi:hypothetical protein
MGLKCFTAAWRGVDKNGENSATLRSAATSIRAKFPVVWLKKRMKRPTAPAIETVAVEVIEQPAPGVITVTEVEDTDLVK